MAGSRATLVLLGLVATAVSVFAVDDPDVVVLTADNFDATVAAPLSLVEFYAPWCGHCKSLAPEYAQAATELKAEGIVLGKVDATVEQELGSKYEVQGYPTLKIFREGVATDYNGGRTASDIVSYMKKQNGPAFTETTDVAAILPAEGSNDEPVVVGYFAAGSDGEKAFKAAANAGRDDFKFYLSAEAKEGQSLGDLVLYKAHDDLKVVFSGELTSEAVVSFLAANSLKWVDEIGPENYSKYVERKLPIAWMFIDPSKADEKDAAIAALNSVAAAFHDKLSLVYLDGVQYSQMVSKMALSGDKLPAFAIETADSAHFPFDESKDITAEALQAFLNDYVEGKLVAKIKSEAIPENPNDETGVRILVGDNFDEIVNDKSKDVLVEFYAPWCGHCKSLAPIYGEVAQEFADNDNVVIAKMDATANDAVGFEVQGFPTIKFVSAKDNEVIEYDGARTKEGFVEFLKKNGKA